MLKHGRLPAANDCSGGSIAEQCARDDGHPLHWLAGLVSWELVLQWARRNPQCTFVHDL